MKAQEQQRTRGIKIKKHTLACRLNRDTRA